MHRSAIEEAWMAWQVDGELHGHSPSQVIGFWSDMADLADGAQLSRSQRNHPDFLSAGRPEPRLFAWWRRRASR